MMNMADFTVVSGDAVGHVSYVSLALSYYLTSIYWLRVTAVDGLLFEIIYFQTRAAPSTRALPGILFLSSSISSKSIACVPRTSSSNKWPTRNCSLRVYSPA